MRSVERNVREVIIHLIKRMKFPMLAVTFTLIVLFVVRPLLLASKAPLQVTRHFKEVASFSEKDGPPDANVDLAGTINTFTGVGARKNLPSAYSGGETFPGADFPF